ncbi:MAG: NUDIX domain-containing protein [Chloroflexi bacterium]|nr:NUDIX domain-containing protein [Chloroflexota bacterium]MBI5963928.1 NUDIX domain-containing protein [Chloroflexota bacterium]
MSLLSEYPRLGVGVIILRDRKVLLGKRKGPRGAGYYGLPGGFLEKHESFEECAKREVWEETGLEGILLYPIYFISGMSENLHYADLIFYTNCRDGEPIVREMDRVEKWNWFDIYDLPSPLYQPTELTLNRFISNYPFHRIDLFLQRWTRRKNKTIIYVDSKNIHENIN